MRFRSVRTALVWALVAAATPAAAATAPAGRRPDCPRLSGNWYGDNRARLQRLIDTRGTCSRLPAGTGSAPQARNAPVAAFDWDNTVTKNDVTDATLAWILRHDRILRPARWKDTSAWLTDAADRALTTACGTATPVGAPSRPRREPAAPTRSSGSARPDGP